MGDQPNISQILAALGTSWPAKLILASTDISTAAQRPSGTPTQGQAAPQQPLQGYPNPYPTPTPPAPAASSGYAIPPPTNSGSVDLSNIKPINSGSVSLADAVARARGIAAEKGVSYDAGRRNGSTL